MALKDNLIAFFKRNIGIENISYSGLRNNYDEITGYRFETPTQFQYFRGALESGHFLEKQGKNVFSFNWDKIFKTFPEVKQ